MFIRNSCYFLPTIKINTIALLMTSLLWSSFSVAADEELQKIKDSSNSIYSAAFFNQYLPQNAFEMVLRLPGFNFDEGSSQRGFGGNAGNVLIDGKRPTSKSGGLRSALVRIPATQVERIEIIRGGVGAGEAAGQSIVANVIRKKTGSAGSWAAKLRRAPDGEILPNVEAAITTQLGNWKTAFDLDFGGGPGYRVAVIENRDEDGKLTSSADEILKDRGRFYFINGEGSSGFAKGELTLNGRIGSVIRNAETERKIFDGRLPDNSAFEDLWNLKEENRFKVAEVSADWIKTVEDWKWHAILLGLVNDTHYENQFNLEERDNNQFVNNSFAQDGLKTEFISRLTFANVAKGSFKPEYGVEIARNKLATDLDFIENGVQVQLSGSSVVVKELRTEVFASFTYSFNKQLSIEGGLTGEFSKIKVFNLNNLEQKQNFKFLKPRLSGTFKADKKTQYSFELARGVGQLNFSDFAASSQASDDLTTAGNPDLAPDVTDVLSASYDWQFSQKGSLKVKVFHEWRSDILEKIILPSGDQGLGNAGDARFWGVQTDINLPIDQLLNNGLIEVSYFYQSSRFEDPIINRFRNVNRHVPRGLNIKLRQDIVEQKISWGMEYNGHFISTSYLVNEIQTFEANNRLLFFIETSRYFGVKTQLEIEHANTGEYTRSRFFYDGNRDRTYLGSEVASRKRRPEIKLTFSGAF